MKEQPKQHVLIATLHYPPDRGPSAPIYQTLAEGLLKAGYTVSVISLQPHYDAECLESKEPGRGSRNGVDVLRGELGFSFRSARGFKKLYGLIKTNWLFYRLYRKLPKPDRVVFHSPVFLCSLFFLAVRKPARLIYHVQDLYPDIYCLLRGTKPQGLAPRLIGWVEAIAMRRADDIVTLTEDMANRIRSRIMHPEKVRVITNPVSLPGIGDAEGKADAGKGERKRFVALFAGNMGPAQGLNYILEASVILQEKGCQCEILLVGDGSEKEKLSRVATEKSLINLKFMPYQAPEALREIYSKADVAIVSLAPGLSSMALPSKLYTAMAAGCPVLGLFDAGSEAEKLVAGQNIGKAITDYDPASIADMIERMASQPEELCKMARNAKLYAEQNLSSGNFLKKFTNILVSGESKNA